VLAIASWSPEDEEKAAVRLGHRLRATERALDDLKQAAAGVALSLAVHGQPEAAATLRDAVTRAHVRIAS
jgi:hypothetical protein